MISWKTLLAGFLIGLVAGVGWGGWYMSERARRWDHHGGRQARLLQKFTNELGLTEAQKDAVAAILRDKGEKIREIHREIRPRMEEIRNEASTQIRVLLDPGQQKKFDALEEALRKRWSRRHRGR